MFKQCRAMSFNVGQCSSNVGQCPSMSVNVQAMSANVLQCRSMFKQCRPMSFNVGQCSSNVGQCPSMSANVQAMFNLFRQLSGWGSSSLGVKAEGAAVWVDALLDSEQRSVLCNSYTTLQLLYYFGWLCDSNVQKQCSICQVAN